MAAGLVVGPIWNHHTLVACLTAVGTVVKGWSEFKKFFRQSGHVPVRLHHQRQSPDRIANLCAWRSLRRTRRLLDQDANPGRHDRGFHPAFAQTLRASLLDAIRVPTSPRPMLRGRCSSPFHECEVLNQTG